VGLRRRLRPLLLASVAVLLMAGCSVPGIRFASPTETSQAARGGKPATGSTATQPSPGVTGSPAPAPVNPAPGTGALSQFQDMLRKIATQASPSVVEVNVGNGIGSGIVLDGRGDIVTNAHVVSGASVITIIASDGRQYPAQLVGSYTQNDLAVIRADAGSLKPAAFADSSKVVVGDVVLAIGAPYGLAGTVTEGIVSATGRTQSEGNGVTLTDLIQTTAGINPGNSGGALVNISGQVIGVPTLSGSDRQPSSPSSPPSQPSENIGFAIPSNQVVDITNQLIGSGTVTHTNRAYLGITTRDDTSGGANVQSVVAGGPADKAGIQAGWTITDIGGHGVADTNAVSQVLSGYKPGDTVKVTLRSATGQTKTVTVTLGERPITP